jgi:hypothetical protein
METATPHTPPPKTDPCLVSLDESHFDAKRRKEGAGESHSL